MMKTVFRLEVEKIEQACSFKLSWGQGQTLHAKLDYPILLTDKYKEWQTTYLSYYDDFQRGRVVENESVKLPPEYWHNRLVNAEAELLSEFHHWLRSAELYKIRTQIASATRGLLEQGNGGIDVFLTCYCSELRRLPWETWEIGEESVIPGTIRIARSATNIQYETVQPRCGRARILVIVGHDKEQNFRKDLTAMQRTLKRVADLTFVDCQSEKAPAELKEQIRKMIADERGWDVLFFAGHSNDTSHTGGELGIAPNVFLSIKEIEQPLIQAKKQGLQFAVFNSCSGLSIAQSLIGIGLSQVAVMREPIHNQVAQEFLVRFLQVLADYKDVHEALIAACQYLKLEKNLTYPSSYLIPSLFGHPDAVPFRIEPSGLKWRLRQWLPTRREVIASGTVLLVSLMVPVQDLLLDARTGAQAIYRHLTNQSENIALPPVLLIAIDQESINRANETIPEFETIPMDREYLAQLISRLSKLKAKTIGIDYLLHTQEPKQQKLADSIQIAVTRKGTWFVFAASENDKWKVVDKIASSKWSLQGDINIFPWDVRLPVDDPTCSSSKLCPFAYLLALSYKLNQNTSLAGVPQPKWQSKGDFQQEVSQYLNLENRENSAIASLKRVYPPFGRFIIDFSIPPDQAYERIPAWEFLRLPSSPKLTQRLEQQVVIVAPGGYTDAEDNFSVPLAIQYWCYSPKWKQGKKVDCPQEFTGGEAHAYIVHHLLSQHRILLIPDFWIVGIAALLGRWASVKLLKQKRQQQQQLVWIWLGATGVYGGIGLQIYVTASISIPWFLPSVMFWIYILSVFKRRVYA